MTQRQMNFGEYIALAVGKKWVYAHRATDRIRSQYPGSIVITPKQQRQLARDYKAAWGREYDPAHWQMLCALRDLVTLHRTGRPDLNMEACVQAAEAAIDFATTDVTS